MAVSRDDVRHIAALARIGVPEERIDSLVRELNGILGHMDVLQQVPDAGAAAERDALRAGMALRADRGPSVPLERPIAEFAPMAHALDGAEMPATSHGYFLVPRLATHEDAGDGA
jgi:aspartyl-tRNA(Asn)/glutamyl-tRNA(Gln) amidotransferase subunit C